MFLKHFSPKHLAAHHPDLCKPDSPAASLDSPQIAVEDMMGEELGRCQSVVYTANQTFDRKSDSLSEISKRQGCHLFNEPFIYIISLSQPFASPNSRS